MKKINKMLLLDFIILVLLYLIPFKDFIPNFDLDYYSVFCGFYLALALIKIIMTVFFIPYYAIHFLRIVRSQDASGLLRARKGILWLCFGLAVGSIFIEIYLVHMDLAYWEVDGEKIPVPFRHMEFDVYFFDMLRALPSIVMSIVFGVVAKKS